MSNDADALSGGYTSTKQEILAILKRHPGESLAQLASELGISKAGVLGHLPPLESEGLVERSYLAGHVGRPRVVFRLTDRAAAHDGTFASSAVLCGPRELGSVALRNQLPVGMIPAFSTISITVRSKARVRCTTPRGTTKPCRGANSTVRSSRSTNSRPSTT